MKDNELKEVIKKAAEIAKEVPTSLQEAAFNRAVEALLAQRKSSGKFHSGKKTARKNSGSTPSTEGTTEGDQFLTDLDRTAHPEVYEAPRVLERALILLRIAKEEFNIDGLGARPLAKILTETFRLRTSYQAVQQTLDAAGKIVHRVKNGRSVIYRIMKPGEDYLDKGEFKSTRGPTRPQKRKVAAKKSKTLSTNARTRKASTKSGSKQKKVIRRHNTPTTALRTLLNDGYFSSLRRIGEIRTYLQKKKGLQFKVTELSPVLLRFLHDELLERETAEDGQYEYRQK